jgi:MFS family permease
MSDTTKVDESTTTPKAVDFDEKPRSSATSSHDAEALTEYVNTPEEERLLRKIDFHLIPPLFVLYLLSFLDRINVSNAKIEGMLKELKITGPQFAVCLMIFFVPYILLELPSNIIIKKVAPSWWLSSLMFFWGVCTMCQGLVTNYAGLVVCRFFLGVFEAGVFPGMKPLGGVNISILIQ